MLASGCGYIGEPLPPLANVPARVGDLAAVQRNARIVVHFSIPTHTTEGVALRAPLKLDLRIGAGGSAAFNAEQWAANAKTVPQGATGTGLATFEIPTAEWSGKQVTIGVRVIGSNGKASAWSNFASMPVVEPPPTPPAPTLEATAEGVRVSWTGPAGEYRIFRRADAEKEMARVADVSQPGWIDHSAEFGKRYAYVIQRIVKLGDNKEAESDPSDAREITPVDKFPPAVPVGLRAAPAAGSIELSWDRNAETDLAGYRIYRATADGAFEKIAEVSQIPTYSDRTAEHGKTYRYALTSFDQSGNESERSPAVEVSLP